MKEPANTTHRSTVVVRVNGNVPWQWRVGSGGNYVAVCDPLKITLQAKTWSELMEDINSTLNALVTDLVESREWDAFMQEHGWTVAGPISAQPKKDVTYDVPFSILPFAGAINGSERENGSQRVLHQ